MTYEREKQVVVDVLVALINIEALPMYREQAVSVLYTDLKFKMNGRLAHKLLYKCFEIRARALDLSLETYMVEVLKIQ